MTVLENPVDVFPRVCSQLIQACPLVLAELGEDAPTVGVVAQQHVPKAALLAWRHFVFFGPRLHPSLDRNGRGAGGRGTKVTDPCAGADTRHKGEEDCGSDRSLNAVH